MADRADRTREHGTTRQRGTQPSATPRAPQGAPQARTQPQHPSHTIVLGGRSLSYTVRVSTRARLIRLVIRPDRGLEVVLPRGASLQQGEALLREKANWVFATLERMAERAPSLPPPISEGQMLHCYGREVRLAIRHTPDETHFRFHAHDGTLTLSSPSLAPDDLRAALERWYRHQARAIFAERVAACNAAYGYTYARISVKDQKSRWGSCSRQGNLNFNWRLLLAPPEVLDYVVYHELAHLKEHNHSSRFWALVARVCPKYQEYRRWLRLHGQELRF